jgi:hypothetical protein
MLQIVFVPVPYPVPCAGVTHWRSPRPPQYPREARERGWPLTAPVPLHDLRAARDLREAGKRLIAEQRASRLRELNGG